MWLQVNMIDETGKVLPVWYLPASQVEGHQWITGRVKLVSKENSDQYRVRKYNIVLFEILMCYTRSGQIFSSEGHISP
jgi:hypothetical protein